MEAGPVDWIVFGDDWGGQPSTTQHLVLNLPAEDRVIWVDSIGMRQPRLRLTDAARVWHKARGLLNRSTPTEGLYLGTVGTVDRVKPKVLPWHLNPHAIRFNARSLGNALASRMARLGMSDPFLASSTPVVMQYLPAIPHRKLAYLRLDDYALYPGVDPELVQRTEPRMLARADAIFATAMTLMPPEPHRARSHYLPHGVQSDVFARVPLDPPRTRILGFFGTFAEWLNFDLIMQVARAAPDWTLEFVGKVEVLPDALRSVPNLRILPPVPHRKLPEMAARWSAAWIPYQLTERLLTVNPLKIREYLAAGLPTHCTPLPEAVALQPHVMVSDQAESIHGWMERSRTSDSPEARRRRREFVQGDSWASRATTFRNVMRSV